MELFFEVHQSRMTQDARDQAGRARQKAEEAESRVLRAEAAANKALLICEALWTMLREKVGASDDELLGRIRELDASDGKLDGKVRRPPVPCPECKRDTPARLMRCIYCGAATTLTPFAS